MTCLSCKNEVTAKPIRYGDGFIATCPKCGKLAMNERRRDEKGNSGRIIAIGRVLGWQLCGSSIL